MSTLREPPVDDLVIVDEIEVVEAERTTDVVDDAARRRRRKILVLVVLAFVVTRGFAGYVADHPAFYGPGTPDPSGDVGRYDELSWAMRHEGLDAYGPQLRMEYPPGAIPIIMIPRYIDGDDYHTVFVALMVLFDAVGLYGLVRIARRGGSWLGAGVWFVLIPALGPVAYTRLDLVVAVLLVWTLERALAGRWEWVGLLIGVGAAVKLVPIVLLPLLFFVAPRDRRRALVGWCGLVVGATVIPFIDELPNLFHSVVTYHTERGIQAESVWGMAVLVARWVSGYTVTIVSSHRAWDASSSVSDALKTWSTVAVGVVGLAGVGLAVRTRVGDLRRASLLVLGVMSLLIGVGKVYSPQYILWMIALGAVAMALSPRRATPTIVSLAIVTGLAHLLFPVWFWDLLFYDKGYALMALVIRNVLTIVTGVLALIAWRACGRDDVSTRRDPERGLGRASRPSAA